MSFEPKNKMSNEIMSFEPENKMSTEHMRYFLVFSSMELETEHKDRFSIQGQEIVMVSSRFPSKKEIRDYVDYYNYKFIKDGNLGSTYIRSNITGLTEISEEDYKSFKS